MPPKRKLPVKKNSGNNKVAKLSATQKPAKRKLSSQKNDTPKITKTSKISSPSLPSTSSAAAPEQKVIKKIEFSGVVPVDEHCPSKDAYTVYKENNKVYNSMLNQTNIGQNNNKYYIMQLLQSKKDRNDFAVWFRWGRVGKVAGQTFHGSLPLSYAKDIYHKQYRKKTGNFFDSPFPFFKKAGKYDLLQMDYGEEEVKKKMNKEKKDKGKKKTKVVPSKLPKSVQELMECLFNVNEFEESVKEMQYDVKKAPLGKLTTAQIKAGYESLKKVEDCIVKKRPKKELIDACSQFYTRIPHDFGMKVPPLITTTDELKKKIELLEALGDIQIAFKLMEDEDKSNLVDSHYNSLNCHLEPLDKKHADFKLVEKYVKNTHGLTHGGYNLKVQNVFQVKREEDEKRFKKSLGNRKLLWHGSRITNWCGILRQGLRIAPPEAPTTGYMFGKGVYFADMVTKSANYCFASRRQPKGFLLLSEVALGQTNDKIQSDYNASNLPKGKHSTKGVGKYAPSSKQDLVLPCGTVVPVGKQLASKNSNLCLMYNEYIVYNVAQIRPKYLIQANFDFK